MVARRRSIREIGDLVQEARDDLRRAIHSMGALVPLHPALGPLSMRLMATRTLLAEVLEELRELE